MGNGKYVGKKSKKTVYVISGICILGLLAIILCLALNRGQKPIQVADASGSETTISETNTNDANRKNIQFMESIDPLFPAVLTDKGDLIEISTKYGILEYSAAFSDVIQIRTEQDDSVSILRFLGKIGDDEVALFDVFYGETDGELIKQIQLEDGSKISVYFATYNPPGNMTDDDINTFYAAQESLNSIIASIMEE